MVLKNMDCHYLYCALCPCCFRMEESNPQSSQSTKSALVVSSAPLVVKGGPYEELVLPSLPLPVGMKREGEELVCGTSAALGDRKLDRQNNLVEPGSSESEGVIEQQGQNG